MCYTKILSHKLPDKRTNPGGFTLSLYNIISKGLGIAQSKTINYLNFKEII